MKSNLTTLTLTVWLIMSLCIGCTPLANETDMTNQDTQQIADVFERQISDVMVEAQGTVDRTLSDDLEGSRHQRFILRLPTGLTVLVSHNIDIAPRIEAMRVGDEVTVRGEYEWNDLGGIIHWTHHDPNGNHPDGWILHNGQRFE